jgi:L-arabinose isomerase
MKQANFIEPFYINKTNNTFAAGHAGPNDYTEKPENMIIARDERFAKSGWKHAGAPFAWYVFPQGEKTMLHISEENGSDKHIGGYVKNIGAWHTEIYDKYDLEISRIPYDVSEELG